MRDITFYDLNFNRLYILPQFAINKGYISAYAQKDFNGVGSLEFVFIDNDLKKLIKQYRENLMIEWNGFFGILCAYRDEPKGVRITGDSLNGLLKRVVKSPRTYEEAEKITSIVGEALLEIDWITVENIEPAEFELSYTTDTYKTMDVYMEELLKCGNFGYEIIADIANKQFLFKFIKGNETNLILSTNNKNAYDFSEAYINRNVAYGGWYPKKVDSETSWEYITLDSSLTGIFKKDTVLKSKTETEAYQELRDLAAKSEVELKTRGVTYGTDYVLGDIVRVQNDDVAVKKRITSVIMSQENGYIENPIFSEVE